MSGDPEVDEYNTEFGWPAWREVASVAGLAGPGCHHAAATPAGVTDRHASRAQIALRGAGRMSGRLRPDHRAGQGAPRR
jgi:hypothetical protein